MTGVLLYSSTGCDQHTLGSGSGLDPATICGQNSMCQNNAECLCNSGYFSPSGSETDCRGTNGMANSAKSVH